MSMPVPDSAVERREIRPFVVYPFSLEAAGKRRSGRMTALGLMRPGLTSERGATSIHWVNAVVAGAARRRRSG